LNRIRCVDVTGEQEALVAALGHADIIREQLDGRTGR
jgi:hypothetical protein